MQTLPKERPTSVTVLGWIFIIAAVMMIFSGVGGLITHNMMQQMRASMPQIPETINMPGPFSLMDSIFEYFDILAFSQMIIAVIMLIAGIQFLRLRAWARTVLEIFTWLGLTWVIGFGIFWIYSWISMTSNFPAKQGTPFSETMFTIMGVVGGSMVVIFYSALNILVLKYLRGKTIREAVNQ